MSAYNGGKIITVEVPDAEVTAHESLFLYASCIAEGRASAETYEQAAKSFIRCLETTSTSNTANAAYRHWAASSRRIFIERLLWQEHCQKRPNIFLHVVCRFASSNVTWVMPTVAREIGPIIAELLREPMPLVDVVVAALVLREHLANTISQEEISRKHREHFPRFGMEDLALPYSCMFLSNLYHRNRSDLLNPNGEGHLILEDQRLRLYHMLLIEWLAERPSPAVEGHRMWLTMLQTRLQQKSEHAEEERSAGRALVARYAAGQELLSGTRLGPGLEAGVDFFATVAGLADSRARLAEARRGRPGLVLPKVTGIKAYQAAQVLANEVRARFAKYLPQQRRRARVALCVSGQLRGYQHTFPTWKRTLLQGVDVDIYVHTWECVGHSGAEPFRAKLPFEGAAFQAVYREQCVERGHDVVRQRYPSLFAALSEHAVVTAQQLQAFYETEFVVLEDDNGPRFLGWSNSQKMHYKIHACSQLAAEQSREYDLIIRIRPDLPVSLVGFGWRDLTRRCWSESLIMADHGWGVSYGHPFIGDQFAVGAPEPMRVYAQTHAIYPGLARQRLHKMPSDFAGHASLAYVCWLHGIQVERVPVKWQALRDPQALSTAAILEAVQQDCRDRDDSWDSKWLSAIWKDQKQ